MTRTELSATMGREGGGLSKVLRDLELCGFTRSYRNFTKRKNGVINLCEMKYPEGAYAMTAADERLLRDKVAVETTRVIRNAPFGHHYGR